MATPMTVEEHRARVGEIDTRLSEIDTEYKGQALPEGARDEWTALNTERDDTKKVIDELVAREARILSLSDEGEERTESISDMRFQTARPGRFQGDTFDLNEYRRLASSQEQQIDLMVDGAKRALEQTDLSHVADVAGAERYAEALLQPSPHRDPGEVARRILTNGSPKYIKEFQRAFTVGSTGTYPVPIALDPTIVPTGNWSINPFRQIGNVETITGTTWKGVTSGDVTAAYAAEAAAASDNTPTLAQPSITPQRAQAFVPFSWETGQDWSSIAGEMGKLIGRAKDNLEAVQFATGAGTTVYPQGVITGATTSVATASAGAFVIGDVYKLMEQLPAAFRPNATWVTNLYALNKVRQFDTAGGAGLVVRLPQGGQGGPGSQQAQSGLELLGRPVYESTGVNTTNVLTTGTKIAVLGDFEYFKIIDRIGLDVSIVPHIFDTSTGYPTGQSGVFAYWRNSSLVLSAGAFRVLWT